MSTLDPRQAQLRPEQQSSGSAGQALLASLFAALTMAAGGSIVYSLISLLNDFVLSSSDLMFIDQTPFSGMIWIPLLFLGFIGVVAFGALTKRAARKLGGGYGQVLKMFPWASFGALTMSLTTQTLLDSMNAGVEQYPSESYSAGLFPVSQVQSVLPFALPAFMFVIFLIMFVAGSRGTAKENREKELAQRGTRTTGTVIEVNGGNIEVGDMPVVSVSVQFTDSMGVVRYVTRRKPLMPGQIPSLNQQVLVIYDPANPAVEKSILIGLLAADAIQSALSNYQQVTPQSFL